MHQSPVTLLLLSISYLVISLLTTVLNKYIISILDFKTPFLLVVLQSVIICTVLFASKLCKICIIDFGNYKKWILPSLFLCVMIFSGSKSLQYLDISFYTLVKNSSIILVAIVELIFYNRTVNTNEILSYFLMIVASYYNYLSVNLYGIIWISVNIISTTIYVVSLRHILTVRKGNFGESILFPNLISIFVIGILSLIFETEIYKVHPPIVFIFITISSVSALITALTTALILHHLSSTTYAMLGAMNKIMLGFMGFIFVGEQFCKMKMYSLILGITSTVLYTYNLKQKLVGKRSDR